VLIVVGEMVTAQDIYVAKEDEVLFGTWINTDYNDNWRRARIIWTSKKTFGESKWSHSELPGLDGAFTINDKWTDSDGNTFYKITFTASGR
jgi:hypothetical protein